MLTLAAGHLVANSKVHPPPPAARRTAGMLAAFITSGLIHEVMFWYAEGRLTGYWLTFFSIQVCASAALALGSVHCFASLFAD